MKHFFAVLLLLQLTFAITLAQITFTREWVTGKRSFPNQLSHKDAKCISFVPAIEYLMETERMRKKECGPYLKASQLPWSLNGDLSKSVKGEESLQFDQENYQKTAALV